MKIVNLAPNTPEWLHHRKTKKNASEASIMMGASKNVTRNELLGMKATGQEQEFSDWFQKNILDNGHEVEAQARPIAEEIVGEELYPVSATDDDGWLAATFDGMTMLEDVNWECKQWNEAKAADVRAGRVPECDYWQVVQQLAINEGSKTLYMVTDGTREKCVHLWVELNPADAETLKVSWRQFDADLAEYTPREAIPEVVGTAPEHLPSLHIEAQGMVTASNLDKFEAHAKAVLSAINMDLQTDQDFANAEKTVKWAKDVEDRLATAKSAVLAQTSSIDEVFRVIDAISAETRDKRLALDKAVKKQKEARKTEIITKAQDDLAAFIAGINEGISADFARVQMPVIEADFAGVIKGKKKLDAMQSALDDELARAKVEANKVATVLFDNLKTLDEQAAEYRFLFTDLQQLITKPQDDFAALVYTRIADYQREQEAKEQREPVKREPANPLTDCPPISYREPDPAERPSSQVTIDRAEYERLVANSKMYLALAAAGVESWEGYAEAMEIMQEAA